MTGEYRTARVSHPIRLEIKAPEASCERLDEVWTYKGVKKPTPKERDGSEIGRQRRRCRRIGFGLGPE